MEASIAQEARPTEGLIAHVSKMSARRTLYGERRRASRAGAKGEPLVQLDVRLNEQSEHDLLAGARAGDAAAFGELVRRHQQYLLHLVHPLVASDDDAEDTVQEAFVEAWRQLDRFREAATFRTWVGRIAVFRAMREAGKPRLMMDDAVAEGRPAAGADQAELMAVREAVQQLPEEFRLPLILRFWREMSGREIAELLGWEQSTDWTRIYRGLEQERRTLEEDRG